MPPSTIRGLVPRRPCCQASRNSIPFTPNILPAPACHSPTTTQVRHATYIPRPRRPYQFTQLIQLSDGSTFTVRTTSPAPVYRSVRDTRNHILWQPSEKALQNVEHDEAGKLAAFRERFGRGFDLQKTPAEIEAQAERRRMLALADKVRKDQQRLVAEWDAGDGRVVDDQQQQQMAATETVMEEEFEEELEEEDDMGDMLSDLISGYAEMVEQPQKKKKAVAAPVNAEEEEEPKATKKGNGKNK